MVIKLGGRGSYFQNSEKAFYCDCYKVPVVDPTGAGDAFVAGFLAGVIEGMEAEECVRFGTATAAFIVQETGATTGMRDFSSVKRFIEEQKALEIMEETGPWHS